MSNGFPSQTPKTPYKWALPPCISPVILRFPVEAGRCKLPAGQREDKALQGCNLSAALEAGAGSESPEMRSRSTFPRQAFVFAADASRCSHLLIKRSLVKRPETSRALPYSYLTNVVTDGYGFYFSLTFSLPSPSSPAIPEFRGEGMTSLLKAILHSSVSQIFDAGNSPLPRKATSTNKRMNGAAQQ
jgi:hypothetical protein